MSNLEYSIKEHPDFLWVSLKGRYTPSDFAELIDALHTEAEERGVARILCDSQRVSGNILASEEFRLGVSIADVWKSSLKVAFVPPPGMFTTLLENAAVNRGANVFVCSDLNTAMDWLTKA